MSLFTIGCLQGWNVLASWPVCDGRGCAVYRGVRQGDDWVTISLTIMISDDYFQRIVGRTVS